MYADASFNNDKDGSSQGGHIVFLKDKDGNSCPITWRSNKVRRIARSTLAAETLAFSDGCESALFINQLAQEATLMPTPKEILGFSDNRSLFEAANTTSQVSDRRLRVEVSMIRQMQERHELTIRWISSQNQLADSLTKKGAPFLQLIHVLKEGRLTKEC